MAKTLENIKDEFKALIGEDIVITVEIGRGRVTVHKGKLTETYPSVFIVELKDHEDSYETVSYSYADVLTDSINVKFPNLEVEEMPTEEEIAGKN